MSQHSVDFARLIHPITPEEFFQEYWEQKPLLVSRKEPTYYHGLFRLDDVDAVLHYCRPKPPDILVVQNQDRMVADTYITDQGTVNLPQLYKAYDEVTPSLLTRWSGSGHPWHGVVTGSRRR
jgi:ribosomal protein L16 Arg81 hydroxylase